MAQKKKTVAADQEAPVFTRNNWSSLKPWASPGTPLRRS